MQSQTTGWGGGGVLQYCKGQRKERRSLMQSQTTGWGGGGVLQYCKGQRKERHSLMQSQTTGWRGEGYYNTARGREKKDVVSCSHRPRGSLMGGGGVLQYCKGQRKERRSLMQSQTFSTVSFAKTKKIEAKLHVHVWRG